MGIVDYEPQTSGLDSVAEPPPSCDRDSLWWALVMVASQRYDEMIKQEKEEVAKVEEPMSLVVQNQVVQADDGEEDSEDRLIIDEAGPPPRDAKRKATEESTGENYQVAIKAVRRPRHMSQVTVDPKVPFQVPVRYNANMARKFPGAENRTPEQQAVRQRNTVAARQSRAKMRIMEEMLTQEATDERTINEYMKERLAACFMYGNALRRLLRLEEADFWAEFQLVKDQYIAEPLRSQHVVPRSISDGSCSDYQDYSDDEGGDGEEEEEEEKEEKGDQQPGTSADTADSRRG
uniref:BZIP domain-containing protein n=1 Tax=Culex tarsalis TaxID=7177 RepID=A0A1Q3EV53_CULTA